MRRGVNPELRKCIDEMESVAKKYNAMAFITLADGKGHGEFGLFSNLDWSCLTIGDGSVRIKASSKVPGDFKKLDMTVNAISNIQGVLKGMSESVNSICDHIKKVIEIEEDKHSGFTPRID